MVCERKIGALGLPGAMIPSGGRAAIRNSNIRDLKALREVIDNVHQRRHAAIVNDNYFESATREGLSGESFKTSAKAARIGEGGYNYGDQEFGLNGSQTYRRIWIYDPGHFTPYYNAGLCGQYAAMGVACTLVTSPATFEAVAPRGYEVSSLFFRSLQGPLGPMLRHRGRLRQIVKAISYPRGVWRAFRELREQEPGVFHIHFAISPVLDALLARALRRRGWRVVYTLQEPQPEGVWNRWQYGRLMATCDVIVMHDESLAVSLRRMFPDCARKITSLTHGMDLPQLPSESDRERSRSSLGVAPNQPLLLFFGMMKPYKGLEELLDAMPAVLARVPEARLCIAGEPLMDMRGVMKRISALPAESVILQLGFVPQAEVGGYFAAADLVITCYREIAASSVLLQAQAHARPVLATRVGALPALVDEGRCGFLAGDNLSAAIVDALADQDRLTELGKRGRERVERLHSWEHVAAATLGLYLVTRKANADPRR